MATPILRRLYLDITNECRSSCLHCYAYPQKKKELELSLEDLKNLVNQMADMRISELIVSGGEPLMRKDLFDFLFYCKQKLIKTTLLTSGMLLGEANVRILKDLGVGLRISLEGVSKETHDHIRGDGSYDAVLNALGLIKAASMSDVSIHFTLNRINIVELLKIPCFLKDLEIKDIVISAIKPAGRALEHRELLIGPSLIPFVKGRINIIAKSRNLRLKVYPDKDWQGFSCPAAFAKCGITSDGRITPCVFMGPSFIGRNVKEYMLEYLWQKDEVINLFRNISINQDCSNCDSLHINNAGCRARAIYYSHGDLSGVDPYCCSVSMKKGWLYF